MNKKNMKKTNAPHITGSWISSQKLIASIVVGLTLPAGAEAAENKAIELPTVIVEGSKESYKADDLSISTITSPLVDTPQSISVITRKALNDQGSTTLKDALRNVPGISMAAGEGGAQGDNLTIRGFTARSDIFLDGMRDFGSYFRDPFNLESVEVLKGPSSVLFGRGSTGGIVNQVSKTAKSENFNRASVALGTNSTKRATIDVNHKLDAIENAAFRINLMTHDDKVAHRDVVENKRFAIAPSLAFGLGTETRLNLNYLHQSENNIPDYGIPWVNSRPANVDTSNYYGFKDKDKNFFKAKVDVATAKFEHDFNDNVTLQEKLRYGHYDRATVVTEAKYSSSSGDVTRNQVNRISTETYLGSQTNLITKFDTFKLKHDLVSGIEVSHETSSPVSYTYTGVTAADLVSPVYDDPFGGTPTPKSNTLAKVDTTAFYATDTLELSKKWQLIAGLRYDTVESSSEESVAKDISRRTDRFLSTRGGIVYKPASNGSIYTSYSTSFNPTAENISLSSKNSSLAPEKNKTYEIGTKWELFKKKLLTTLAVFRSEKINARTVDPTDSSLNVLSGKQRVQGVEFQATGNITHDWQVITGYAYMDSEVLKSNTASEVGNSLMNVPKHSVNLWTTYKFSEKVQVGGGANYLSSRNASLTPDSDTGKQKKAPSYITYSAMAKYEVNKNLNLQLNIYNLTNEHYFDQLQSNRLIPGAGRTALLTANFSF
jgi:catecholate siderophore receptor